MGIKPQCGSVVKTLNNIIKIIKINIIKINIIKINIIKKNIIKINNINYYQKFDLF